jgi:energy-coupling factor transporter ATP-binding protein EcfA2
MTALVTLEHVRFTYAGASRPALDGVSLTVAPGEILAVAGATGAGASTLLLVATGYAPRVVGGTLTGSREITARRCGVVFSRPWTQLTGLCSTVREEVAFGPASYGLPPGAVADAAAQAMAALGIGGLAGRDPAHLSGGELQRVVVAATLAMGPDLLALDDPAAELDPEAADALYAVLPGIAEAGTGVLLATPDLDRAARVATRVVRLEHGQVVADGTPPRGLEETTVAVMARAAGCPAPYPTGVAALRARVAR